MAPVNPVVPVGTPRQLMATATYSDNSTMDVTALANWSSSAPAVAIVDATGLATVPANAARDGSAVITASLEGITGHTTLTAGAPVLAGLVVTPPSTTLTTGLTATLGATTRSSDNTTADVTASATWATTNPAVATVSNGTLTGVGAGTCIITATFAGMTATSSVTVTAATVVSFTISPASASVAKGLPQPFTATATFSTGLTGDISSQVSWTSSSPSVASLSNTGLAASLATGTTTISATYDGVSATNTGRLTVTPAAVASILITPANPLVVIGTSQPMTATGNYTDGTQQNLTQLVTWSASGPAAVLAAGVATVPATTWPGRTAHITATLGALSASTTLTADVPALPYDTLVSTPTIPAGQDQFYKVTLPTPGDYAVAGTFLSSAWSTYSDLGMSVPTGTCTTAPSQRGCLVTTSANDTTVYIHHHNALSTSVGLTLMASPATPLIPGQTTTHTMESTRSMDFYTVQYFAPVNHTLTTGNVRNNRATTTSMLLFSTAGFCDVVVNPFGYTTGSFCTGFDVNTTKYLVEVNNEAASSMTYDLNAAYANQGTQANPVTVTAGTPLDSEFLSSSAYQVTYPTAGSHTITVTPNDNNPELYVYWDAAFTALAGSSAQPGSATESVTVTTGVANATVYILVKPPAGGANASYVLLP